MKKNVSILGCVMISKMALLLQNYYLFKRSSEKTYFHAAGTRLSDDPFRTRLVTHFIWQYRILSSGYEDTFQWFDVDSDDSKSTFETRN